MTTEFVLLLGLFAFIFVGAFASDSGPVKVFRNAAPRLGAKVEKSIAVGNHPNGLGFYSKKTTELPFHGVAPRGSNEFTFANDPKSYFNCWIDH